MSRTSFFFAACLMLIGWSVSQGIAQDAASAGSQPARFTIAPHASSRIAMKTLPKAVCMLHMQGDSDPSNSFKLFSDDEGMVRFNVNPSEESDEVAAFAADCSTAKQSRTFSLELRPSSIPTLEMPAPAAEIRSPKAGDVIRPALTDADALQLSDEELVQRGYPMRPHPEDVPGAFAKWREVVTHPARQVNSRQLSYPEVRAGSASATGWSGYDLKNAPNEDPVSTYDMVQGIWDVPTVTNPILGQTTYSVFWVGLDGDNGICPSHCSVNDTTSDLWQAGTGQQIHQFLYRTLSGTVLFLTVSSYYAWTELIPGQSIQELSNFNVSPGDLMYVAVWVGNPNKAASLSGSDGIAFLEDVTKSEFTYVYAPLGNLKILGYQAEWIMERPYINGSLPDLADYGTAYMQEPDAQQINGAWISYDQPSNTQIEMVSGDVLATAASDGPDTIQYQWFNYN